MDSIKNELGVLTADGRFQRTLLKEGLNNPRALVIDMESRQLFYSDWSRDAPKIGRIALDGSGNKGWKINRKYYLVLSQLFVF